MASAVSRAGVPRILKIFCARHIGTAARRAYGGEARLDEPAPAAPPVELSRSEHPKDHPPMTHILIAGGGTAGLTAALSLHAAGFGRITVAEAARTIQPVGAGLNIMPNAVRELDALGLFDALDRQAVRTPNCAPTTAAAA
ncbi:FAD-dependent monooxygenase [Streptomyces sp. NPDC003016]